MIDSELLRSTHSCVDTRGLLELSPLLATQVELLRRRKRTAAWLRVPCLFRSLLELLHLVYSVSLIAMTTWNDTAHPSGETQTLQTDGSAPVRRRQLRSAPPTAVGLLLATAQPLVG